MITLSLNGTWQLYRTDSPDTIIQALVPGCVHADLLREGVITDPNWRDQEMQLQWVGKTAWTYTRTFDVTPEMLSQDEILLRAEGLDTLAEVRLNDALVAHTENQHITWEWSIKPYLRAGKNCLRIQFTPPDALLEQQGKIRPLTAWNEYHGYKHRGWLRKAHSNFGWDWSPVLVSCGIWRPISLTAFSGVKLEEVKTTQDHGHDGTVTVGVEVGLRTTCTVSALAEVELFFEERLVTRTRIVFEKGNTSGTTAVRVEQPERWWPNGLGAQPLYTLVVRLLDAEGIQVDHWRHRIGLRTLSLVRKPDEWGQSFQFECNGIPFFVKGSNWVPPLPYPAWPAGDGWKTLLRDAAAVHMNMMRMWGGAYFAPDDFFDLCDELGLTVWQDFLFACGPYPAFDQRFLDGIEQETKDNVRRLRHHPCIALWCGNNELEPSFVGPEWTESHMSVKDYDVLFHGLLPRVVSELAPGASYWPASPSHPDRNRAETQWAFRPDAGDIHIWEVWFSDAPFETYRKYPHRFISEFGFQSFPHPKTIASYTRPDERQFNSPAMEHHQRSQPGNTQLLKFILQWFRFPEKRDDLILLTQMVQAMAVKIGVEHWRRSMPRTMGSLYWQLNDSWPCPSWSSIDFFGRWKALHHFAAHFYAPVLVSGLENADTGTVAAHLSNDLNRQVTGEVRCTTTDLDGNLLDGKAWPVSLPAGSSCEAGLVDLQPLLNRYGKDGLLVWLDFAGTCDTPLSQNLVLFDRPKKLSLRPSGLRHTVQPAADGTFLIEVTVEKPALWVWLDTEAFDTRFSDNFRCLRPGETWRVTATPERLMTAPVFVQALCLRDLHATYA